MTENTALPQRPSDDLAVLERQILNALSILEDSGEIAEGAGSYRPFIRHAQVLAWQGVARRRPGAPREVLDHLQSVQPFIDAFLPTPDDPREEAALDLYFALDSLYLADGALEESRVEGRLANRDLSLTEREVLRVLLRNRSRYLRRGEVQRLLNLVKRPTPARISQILANFDHENLLLRMQGRAQGNPDASFYALSPQGVEVCRHLGLNRRPAPYFRLEEESWKEYLTPDRIAVREDAPMEPGRVVAVWSYRGGVGRTGVIAQAALPLAARMEEAEGRLLVLDFDLESPGLDAHFAPEGLGECRGLRGLVVDFYRVPPAERSKWLRKALLAPGYVLRPKHEEHPNLYYLPSGFGLDSAPGLDDERAEACDRLQGEARRWLGEALEEGEEAGPTFLAELRAALREDLYARTLVDSRAGLGLSAWAAVLELADELVLCSCLSDLASAPMRVVLGNFLRHQFEKTGEKVSRVGFLVTKARPGEEKNLDAWIEREILRAPEAGNNSYRTVALSANEAIDWLGLLEGEHRERMKRWRYRARILQSIEAAFNADLPSSQRDMVVGHLTSIQDPVLSRVVVEAVTERATINIASLFDAVFLHDLATREHLQAVERTLANSFVVAQRVALNMGLARG